MQILADSAATTELITRRFRDFDFFRDPAAQDLDEAESVDSIIVVIPDPPPSDDDVLLVHEFGSGVPLLAGIIDGYHRLFLARLFRVERLPCRVISVDRPKPSLRDLLIEEVEIVDVILCEVDSRQLWGHNIEAPQPGSLIDNNVFGIMGWVLDRSSPAVRVEVTSVHNGSVMQRASVTVRRPDVATAFPGIPGADRSGFYTAVGVPVMVKCKLEVRVVLHNRTRVSLGMIQGHCR
jgi:hypothetical protein